ncbi:hypothetical protein DYQ86_21055 [Acidobacteria bacterium AB60]|nr:hypothetical protein DYQ86_21055 [Acidobacteria bacterium AB60]
MSLLEQNTSPIETSAPGEELTKGSSHIIWASVIAGVLVTIAIAIYVIAGQKPPAATGEVTRAVAHLMHRETTGLDAAGAPMPKEEFDQVLLFTHIKLHNQSKNPLFLRQIMANVTMPDGIHTAYAATPGDYERLFTAYPELAFLHAKPIALDDTIPAGEWLEGDFVSAFRMTRADWEARKDVDYSVSFRYQPDLKLTPTIQIPEQ